MDGREILPCLVLGAVVKRLGAPQWEEPTRRRRQRRSRSTAAGGRGCGGAAHQTRRTPPPGAVGLAQCSKMLNGARSSRPSALLRAGLLRKDHHPMGELLGPDTAQPAKFRLECVLGQPLDPVEPGVAIEDRAQVRAGRATDERVPRPRQGACAPIWSDPGKFERFGMARCILVGLACCRPARPRFGPFGR